MNIASIIKRPIISEKAMKEVKGNKYSFEVAKDANKDLIKKAIEKAFDVHVVSITTTISKGKRKRVGKKRAEITITSFKKAVVGIKEGEKIGIFEEGAAK